MSKILLTTLFIIFSMVSVYPLDLPGNVKDIKSYSKYLEKNFKYKRESKLIPGDYWQTPEETMKSKRGDCEDFATLTYTSLIQLGYEPTIYLIYLEREEKIKGHAVCTVRKEDRIAFFSNTSMRLLKYTNEIKLILNDLDEDMKKIYIVTKIKYGRIYYFSEIGTVKVWEEK